MRSSFLFHLAAVVLCSSLLPSELTVGAVFRLTHVLSLIKDFLAHQESALPRVQQEKKSYQSRDNDGIAPTVFLARLTQCSCHTTFPGPCWNMLMYWEFQKKLQLSDDGTGVLLCPIFPPAIASPMRLTARTTCGCQNGCTDYLYEASIWCRRPNSTHAIRCQSSRFEI